jgi:hypothetical protein
MMVYGEEVTCFVLMPSGNHGEYHGGRDESDFVYNHIIKPALEEAGAALERSFRPDRETDNWHMGAIPTSIVTKLAKSPLAIVDVTGCNPNVLLELGIRYTFKRSGTILMCRKVERDLPFDLKAFRAIRYNVFKTTEAIHDVARSIITASSHTRNDSPVYDTFRHLDVVLNDLPGIDGVMPWSQYWSVIAQISQRLKSLNGLCTSIRAV